MKINEWFYLSPEHYRLKARDEMSIAETHDALQHIEEPEYRSIHHWKPIIEAQLRAKQDDRDIANAAAEKQAADARHKVMLQITVATLIIAGLTLLATVALGLKK